VTDDPAFRFDCGATWLNLLATRGQHFGAHPVERIPTAARLRDWLAGVELSPERAVSAADLALAWRLRELLRPIALATVSGERPDPEQVAALELFVAGHPVPVRLRADGRLTRRQPATTAEAFGRIARQAVDQLTGPEREFLSSCPEDDCRGVFSDPSGRRRWCPSPACASRGRVRALRARRAQAARSDS
jgi:predicted RNA-binding Zn ribbon-like protein